MKGQSLDNKTIQARIRILQSLKIAIAETNKLNKLLDEMHDTLVANRAKKAA